MAIPEQPDRAGQDRARSAKAEPATMRTSQAQPVRDRPARTRPIRVTLVGLLLVPLVALVGLWAFVASITLGNVIRFQHYNTLTQKISSSVAAVQQDLAQESSLTEVWLGSGRRMPEAQLLTARRSTDASAVAARAEMTSMRGLLDPAALSLLNSFLADLAGLPRIRAAVDSGADNVVTAYRAYDATVTTLWAFFHISSPPTDPTLSLMNQSALAAGRAESSIGGAVSLIDAALAARGQMTQPERVLFVQTVTQQNLELGDAFTGAPSAIKPVYQRAFSSPVIHRLLVVENQIESSPANQPIPVTPQAFQAIAGGLQTAMQTPLQQLGIVLSARSAQLRDSLVTQLALAGGLGLLAALVSAFVAVRFGRLIRNELTALHDGAEAMANEGLPHVIERLRNGDEVDVDAESPPLAAGKITEVARVADAFSAVQRTAVDAAVGQANLRKGVNQVFLNLSLRNQSLLHRQLGMLDTMERATHDSAALGDLFRLDHLTTRMRRHAEGLIILSGATPARGWLDPVPILDVLRAAIAEIEDYIRVDVATESPDSVVGPAVNDVIHLIAELIENATTFSPPNTHVEIRADAVGVGFAVEIEDRGLGLVPEELADINARLASPPEFDLANSDQLGLFVVGQLAARHGIRVSLRESPYGGTTAIALLPHSIIVREGETGPQLTTRSGDRAAAGMTDSTAFPAGTMDPAGDRERALAFSLTGRHRLEPVPDAPERSDQAPDNGGGERAWPGEAPAVDPWLPVSQQPASQRPAPQRPGPRRPQQRVGAQPQAPRPAAQPGGSRETVTAARENHDQVSQEWVSRDPADAGTHPGLPRRVRQANLAPQLRVRAVAEPAAGPHEPEEPDLRSPEETRSLMSLMQSGWQRGRIDDLDYPDDGPGDWPGGTPGAAPDPSDGEVV